MAPDLRTLIDAYATGHTIDWDAAADLTATQPPRLRRQLRQLATDRSRTRRHRLPPRPAPAGLEGLPDHGADNNLDTDLADNAATIHAITCAWITGTANAPNSSPRSSPSANTSAPSHPSTPPS